MATNVFFNPAVRSEQHLYEDLVIESLKIYGQDVIYLPRNVVSNDEILNEEFSKFRESYTVEMYIANIDGFEGEGNLLSKFGLEIRDQATFIVARRRFEQLVDIENNDLCEARPREGDLIYLPLSNSLFEIRFVEHESPFYQLSNLPTYELQCELFEYSAEDFETGISSVDAMQRFHGTRWTIEIEGGAQGFAPGDEVKQIIGDIEVFGVVSGFEETQRAVPAIPRKANLYLSRMYASDGSFTKFTVPGTIINITRDHDDWSITKFYDLNDGDNFVFPSDNFADNSTFEVEADEIIDFSEINPFGEPRI